MPLFQGFRPVAGTICPSRAAAVVGPSRAPQGMKKGRRPRRRPRLKLSDKAGPDQCPVPGENALFPAQIAGFLAVSRPVPVYPVFLKYVVSVQQLYISIITKNCCKTLICESSLFILNRIKVPSCPKGYSPVSLDFSSIVSRLVVFSLRQKIRSRPAFSS